jgi:hypothetical protein
MVETLNSLAQVGKFDFSTNLKIINNKILFDFQLDK